MEASQVFADRLLNTLPDTEVSEILSRQNQVSMSLQTSTASLKALNEFSTAKWTHLHHRFDQHTILIKDLQQDLDHIFRTIRLLKSKLDIPNMQDSSDEEDHDEQEQQRE